MMKGLMSGYAGAMLLVLGGGELLARPPAQLVEAGACRAIDGDTLRCGRTRVMLLGIDAAETNGHCRQGRVCAPGDVEGYQLDVYAIDIKEKGGGLDARNLLDYRWRWPPR